MQNLSDNDLDNLFKKAASESEPEFDPADWKDLAQRLSKPAPVFSPFLKAASIAVVTGSLIWLSLVIHQSTQNKPLTSSDASTLSPAAVSKSEQQSGDLPSSTVKDVTKDSEASTDSQVKEIQSAKSAEKISTKHQALTESEDTDDAIGQTNNARNTEDVDHTNTPAKPIVGKGEVHSQDVATSIGRHESPSTKKINVVASDRTNKGLNTGNAAQAGAPTKTIEGTAAGNSPNFATSTEGQVDPSTKRSNLDGTIDQTNKGRSSENAGNTNTLTKPIEGKDEVNSQDVASSTKQDEDPSTKKPTLDNANDRTDNGLNTGNVGLAGTSTKTIEGKDGIRQQDVATSTGQHEDPSTKKLNVDSTNDRTNNGLNTIIVDSNANTPTKPTEGKSKVHSEDVASSTQQYEDPSTKKPTLNGANDRTNNGLTTGNMGLAVGSTKTIEGASVNSEETPVNSQHAKTGEVFQPTTPSQKDGTENSKTAGSSSKRSKADKAQTETAVASQDSIEYTPSLDRTDSSSGTVDEKKTNKEEDSDFSRLAVKASITPDFSSDSFKKTDKTGLNYGVQVEYFLTRNLSVSAGAIWSRKYYSASNVNYLMFEMEKVQGDCRMWDIPLNLSYYATPSKPYSVFVSAGFSSYLMNSEKYTFEMTTIYDGTQQYSMEVKNGNNEWFKVMNISFGLQGKLSKHLAFQVEPFLKVPLAEIGAGKVELSSFGSYFSLLYRFSRKHN